MAYPEKPQLIWDESEIYEAQVEFLVDSEGLPEEEAKEQASSDSDIYTWAWEDLLGELDEYMEKINPDGMPWRAEVAGFGWRGQSGWSVFSADNAKEFLSKILPKTDCTFHIWIDEAGREIKIRNWHHDAPMGDEWYTIRPAIAECEVCAEPLFDKSEYKIIDGEIICKECLEES